jgi:hypothetical protein
MRLHSSTGAIFFSSFSMKKKRQKVIQGRCDVLENPRDASRLVLGMFYFTTALPTIARTACGA